MKNPATAGRKQGSSKIASLAAGDNVDSLNTRSPQQPVAVLLLSRRFGIPLPTATAIAEANCWGCP